MEPFSHVVLDRDGVINVLRNDYVKTVEEFIFIKNSLLALKNLSEANKFVHIATNQSVVGRGIITENKLFEIHQHLNESTRQVGAKIDSINICIHSPDDKCDCRKPGNKMLTDIMKKFSASPSDLVFIGDSISDYLAAKNSGVRFFAVMTGNLNANQALSSGIDQVFLDLYSCVNFLLER